MAFKCYHCGWSTKKSQLAYYQRKGIKRSICPECNPGLKQRWRGHYLRFVTGLFKGVAGQLPPAMFPYLPLAMLIPLPSVSYCVPFGGMSTSYMPLCLDYFYLP